MRLTVVLAVAVLAALAGAAMLAAAVVTAPAFANLTAAGSGCTVTVDHENGGDNAIQTAINSYPGGTICVGSGSFPEQLTIESSGTTLKGAGDAKTIIDPGSLALNTYDFDSGYPAAAIILVAGSSGTPATGVTGVTVEDLEVNGGPGQNSLPGNDCALNFLGVDFQASSGTLTSANVTGIQEPASDFGCQGGLAVYAYNGYFTYEGANHVPDSVTISHTLISAYDKNGITCDDPEESCTISSNTVTGIGANTLIAQNGIQVAWGAYASLSHNTVTQNGVYTGPNGCTGSAQGNNLDCAGNEGAGILLYIAATGTTVTSNTVSLCQYGIAVEDAAVASDGYAGPASITVNSNTVESSVAYGIAAEMAPGDTVLITSNTVNNEATENPTSGIWGAPGILVDTGNFTISSDKVYGSSTGNGGSNGASQQVCGPSGNFYACTPSENITTAAIQGTSENGSYQTNVTVSGVQFEVDNDDIATLGVLGGAVNIVYV